MPFVIKLIEQGKMTCRLVGTHRHIKLTELIRYRDSLGQASQAAREEKTKSAEKHGWGYRGWQSTPPFRCERAYSLHRDGHHRRAGIAMAISLAIERSDSDEWMERVAKNRSISW